MLKPIVSMNQMAMNESIATTCCYTWNGNKITGSATVLHGGKIVANTPVYYIYPGSDGVTSETNELVVSTAWLNADIVPLTKDLAQGVGGFPAPQQSGGEWYYNGTRLTNYGKIKEEYKNVWTYQDPYKFYTKMNGKTTLNHVGSTSGHYKWTSGNDWLADHPAEQFSS